MSEQRAKSIDVKQEEAFKAMIDNNSITCDFETFKKSVNVYQTAHAIYIDADEFTSHVLINDMISATAEDITGYKNAIDWAVQKHDNTIYLEDVDLYVVIRDEKAINYTQVK